MAKRLVLIACLKSRADIDYDRATAQWINAIAGYLRQ